MVSKTLSKIEVPVNGQIRVDWKDYVENRTVESVNRVKSYFSKKYNVPVNSIKINFIPIVKNSQGKDVEIHDGLIENIMDISYQRKLFNEWLKRNDIKIDIDRLYKLDDQVNSILKENGQEDYRYRKWYLKNIWLDNFLSYGDNNNVDYGNLKGLNIVTSIPENRGGKTSFSVDALLFLFFGKTTKTDTAIEIFNTYTDKNELSVKGLINIDGNDYMIERSITRKSKKAGGYTTASNLDFYRILSDGNKENLEGEQRRETDKLITETIGSYDDFMTTIVATAKNLDDLLETKATERGRLLTKFIGLEVIEQKEEINKKLMSDFKTKMKSNIYNTKDLESGIELNKQTIKDTEKNIEDFNTQLLLKDDEIKVANSKKDDLLVQKVEIDSEIKNINPTSLQTDIDNLIKKGVFKKEDLDKTIIEINDIGEVIFDEDEYSELTDLSLELKLSIGSIEKDIKSYNSQITQMKDSEFCTLCKQPLKDVDHSDHITELLENIRIKESELKENNNILSGTTIKINTLVEIKQKSEKKDKLGLVKERIELDIDKLRVDVRENKSILKEYEKNIDSIEKNRSLDSKILGYNQLITNLTLDRDKLKKSITDSTNTIIKCNDDIVEKESLIKTILKESEVLKIFEVYHKMIGKNGISKLVLTSVIPIINYEIQRLLDDVCDFDIELNINDKNEVEFLIINNDVVKNIKTASGLESTLASLALRCVLGRVSTLPKPNIIVFDEILGKVANVNLDYVKLFFDRLKEMYEVILFITHNPIAQDWADKIISIEKNNDISSVYIK